MPVDSMVFVLGRSSRVGQLSQVQVWYSSDVKNDMCAGFTEKNQQQLRDDYDTDENEAESERDKQAVLAGNDGDKNGRKCV